MGLIFALTLTLSGDTNLSLNDCFLKAVQRSYSLANQGEALKQTEEHYTQAWQNFTPILSLAGSDTVSGYFSPNNSITNNGAFKLSLSQPLFRGFKNIAILEQSKDLIKSQSEAREWAYYQLYLDTAQAFYNILSVQKQLEHCQVQLQLFDKRIQEINAWVRIGRSRGSDLSGVKASRALSYSQMIQYEGILSNSVELFRFLTGISNDFTLADETNLPSTPEKLNTYLESMKERADIIAAKYQAKSASRLIEIAKSDRLPWADFTLSAGDAQFRNNTPWNWNLQLSLTFSLFADTFVQSRIREAESIRNQSDNAYLLLFESIRKDVRTSYAAFLSYLEQIKAYQESLKYLKDNLHQLERDFRLGAVKITDVLSASSSYEDALRTLETLNFQARMEYLRLHIYSGKFLLPDEGKL
jgi:outer membrane protein